MTSRDFCYWLQGFFEITSKDGVVAVMSREQADCIQRHLNLVFKHEIDPSMGDAKHQAELNAIHNEPKTEEEWTQHWIKKYGPCPHPGWEVSMHGWYDPKGGIPRC